MKVSMLFLYVIACCFAGTQAIGDTPLAQQNVAEAAISDGDTITNATDDSVAAVVVEDWSRYHLTEPIFQVASGNIVATPVPVLPAKRELMMRLSGDTTGTGSWLVEGENQRLFLMWEFSGGLVKTLALGLSRKGYLDHPDYAFDHMMSGGNTTDLQYMRWGISDTEAVTRMYYGNGDSSVALIVILQEYRNTGYRIQLQVLPNQFEDLAQPILQAFNENHLTVESGAVELEFGVNIGQSGGYFKYKSNGESSTEARALTVLCLAICSVALMM